MEEENASIDRINDQIVNIVKEAAIETAGKMKKQKFSKLSDETKKLMERRRNRKPSNIIESVELNKLINKKKREDVRKFNIKTVNEAIIQGTSFKTAKRKLGIGRSQMFAIRKPDGEITHSRKDLIKVVEDFYKDLYCGDELTEEVNNEIGEFTAITVGEIKTALKSMKRGKAAGDDGVSVDILKAGGDILVMKLANLFNKCLSEGKTPKSWKNAVVVHLHKKGDTKN